MLNSKDNVQTPSTFGNISKFHHDGHYTSENRTDREGHLEKRKGKGVFNQSVVEESVFHTQKPPAL